MRQKNRRRSLLTLYHHHGYDKRISSENHNHDNNHLLHSDKSTYTNTYFYRYKSILHKLVSLHLGPQNSAHTSIPLLVSGFGLLVVLGLLLNPNTRLTDKASAVEQDLEDGSKISFTIINDSTGKEVLDDETVSTDAEAGQLAYISNTIKVNTTKIGRYYIGVQAAEGSSNNLVGEAHKATITGVGENVMPENFGDNTWGYALTDDIITEDEELAYSTLPEYNAAGAAQYRSPDSPDDGEHNLKLIFAAKIRANKPGDHYQTKAIVSIAAEAQTITSLNNITKMSQLTPEICAGTRTPDKTEFASVPSKRLIDDRDGAGEKYWVAKLADGNCWMTQNLDYNKNTVYDPGVKVINGYSLTDVSNGDQYVASESNEMDKIISGPIYNAHYLIGNFYTYEQSLSICPSPWKLPLGGTQYNSTNGSFHNLLTYYNMATSSPVTVDGVTYDIAKAPLFMLKGGRIPNGASLVSTGTEGYYWSSIKSGTNDAFNLYLYGAQVSGSSGLGKTYGISVRCMVEGA